MATVKDISKSTISNPLIHVIITLIIILIILFIVRLFLPNFNMNANMGAQFGSIKANADLEAYGNFNNLPRCVNDTQCPENFICVSNTCFRLK